MSNNINAAETWDRVYTAFKDVNFVAYDYDTVKESLIQYLKTYYPENFNDFIESSELIAFIETFAYVCELVAYRTDMVAHENSITHAERKESILRLAKFISYNATRNLPARGLIKVTNISTSERILDSQGNNLANKIIKWNDTNNPLWKEQFFIVMNHILTRQIGNPEKAYTVDDVSFQLYELNATGTSFIKGVFPYSVQTNVESIGMEVVSVDLDNSGLFERAPDGTNKMNILYSDDGLGDSSDLTGFLLYTKQGQLISKSLSFDSSVPNRTVNIDSSNINNVDVWLNELNDNGTVDTRWEIIDNNNGQNIYFNVNKNRKKFEIESLEDDKIKLVFGDGNFSNIPAGQFELWYRTSINRNVTIHKTKVIDKKMNFNYVSDFDLEESVTMSFSLINTLQNSAVSEDIEHIRRNAPLTYYSQSRMVNGQDYNTLLLKESSVLKLKSVNRTFAGQSKFIDWNDPTGNYQNVKLFGDDLRVYYDFLKENVTSTLSERSLIDNGLEPLLKLPGLQNMIHHITTNTPGLTGARSVIRTSFIEDANLFQEKTELQGIINNRYYGEPDGYETINNINYGIVNNDTDTRIYDPDLPMISKVGNTTTVLEYTSGTPGTVTYDQFGLAYDRTTPISGEGGLTVHSYTPDTNETITIECISVNDTDTDAVFSITSNINGLLGTQSIGNREQIGNVDFTLTLDVQNDKNFILGDAFILPSDWSNAGDTVSLNLNGQWRIITGTNLDLNGDFTFSPDPQNDSSWLIAVERNEDQFGNLKDWTITYRNLKIVVESSTTKFWHNDSSVLIDSETKRRVRDKVVLLKSNLNSSRTFAIGANQSYDVVDSIKNDNGTIDVNSLEVFPSGNIDEDIDVFTTQQFIDFVRTNGATIDYVYFKKEADNTLTPIEPTSTIIGLFNAGEFVSTNQAYERRIGRDDLDFLWQHYSPNSNLIDPSVSNIIDVYVITKGYYDNVTNYINGKTPYVPVPPSALELRTTYKDILQTKMMSDTVVMHSGNLKLLFGELADPQLRSKFRVIKKPTGQLTDDQIRLTILDVINEYFDIRDWEFGKSFYATELSSKIHNKLENDISSVVLVPTFINNSFGSLFVVDCAGDEILQSAATVNDIEIVDTYTPQVLRQN